MADCDGIESHLRHVRASLVSLCVLPQISWTHKINQGTPLGTPSDLRKDKANVSRGFVLFPCARRKWWVPL